MTDDELRVVQALLLRVDVLVQQLDELMPLAKRAAVLMDSPGVKMMERIRRAGR